MQLHEEIKKDFPIFSQPVNGQELAYLDSAATTLKPQVVVDALSQHYLYGAANVHRGVHYLSEQATQDYEAARDTVRDFINAKASNEIVFTAGTTHSLNILAHSLGSKLQAGDLILTTEMEHHANFVPWQMAAKRHGLRLEMIPLNPDGTLDQEAYHRYLDQKPRIVTLSAMSNAIGTITPLTDMLSAARSAGALTVVDGAQAVAHSPVDMQELGCDFYVFSGHKIFGPTGIGVLYGSSQQLDQLEPCFGGGGMIQRVSLEQTTFAATPERFEAGTPHIAGAIGLKAALDYVSAIGLDKIQAHEAALTAYGTEKLANIPGVKLLGSEAPARCAIFSFTMAAAHPHDIGTILDEHGVAVRSGHHCCQPLMSYFKVSATTRASLSIYNSKNDIDRLCAGLHKVQEIFG